MATLRQQKLAKVLSENPRLSTSKAMRKVGYSERYAEKPQDVTRSKGFREVFSETFTDEVLKKAHDQLLNAKQIVHVPFPHKLKDEEIKELIEKTPGCKFLGTKRFMTQCTAFFFAPDTVARDKALDKAYKVRGNYAQLEGGTGNDPFSGMSLDELDDKIADMEEFTKRAKSFRKRKAKSL